MKPVIEGHAIAGADRHGPPENRRVPQLEAQRKTTNRVSQAKAAACLPAYELGLPLRSRGTSTPEAAALTEYSHCGVSTPPWSRPMRRTSGRHPAVSTYRVCE